jgi:nucleoside-diphosphate-sugar epimerase
MYFICINIVVFTRTGRVQDLIENGYRVRGTVRSLKNKDQYNHLYQIPNADSRLELVEADLLTENSFDEAVKGCAGVFHVASPFFFGGQDPQRDFVDPALNGTRNVFSSVIKNLDTVKRVVVTSSVAALFHASDVVPGKVYTEADWNTGSSVNDNPYSYSKVIAEREAWKIAKEHNISMTTINPPFILGPVVAKERVKTVQDLNASNAFMLNYLTKSTSDPCSANSGVSIVHAKDVAKAHRLAFESSDASGNRFICSATKISNARICKILLSLYPQFKDHIPSKVEYPENVDSIEEAEKAIYSFSSDNLQSVIPEFGDFISVESTIKETVDSIIEIGLLKHE